VTEALEEVDAEVTEEKVPVELDEAELAEVVREVLMGVVMEVDAEVDDMEESVTDELDVLDTVVGIEEILDVDESADEEGVVVWLESDEVESVRVEVAELEEDEESVKVREV